MKVATLSPAGLKYFEVPTRKRAIRKGIKPGGAEVPKGTWKNEDTEPGGAEVPKDEYTEPGGAEVSIRRGGETTKTLRKVKGRK